ncbi:MAG TPA: response regulator transcription factor [Planctomycetaceae bacterium]|nr:response regulator transcription factor [Planctomycetaceae bacterium]
MLPRPIRLVVVDDHQVLLDLLTARLRREPDFEVVGTAANGDDGLHVLERHKPDVAVLNVELPGRCAFEVARETLACQKSLKVLFLTGYLSDVFVEEALRLGSCGYLMKGEPTQVLIDSIRSTVAGETCFSDAVRSRIVYDDRLERYVMKTRNPLLNLTSRQLQVMRLLAHGQSVKEVARRLHLSEKSVDSHKYRIMHKLGIHDRVELARYAIREGLMLP